MGDSQPTHVQTRILWGLLGVYALVLVRTAWLNDDCFITLRVVDNMSAGYGARWNIADRVQVFTHPLWFLLIAAVHAVTHEFFFSLLTLSIALSLGAAWVLATWRELSPVGRALGLTALILSTSFVDYSTSGLENPLTHLLLVCFFRWGGVLTPGALGKTGALLLVGLMLCNREDTLLLVLPAVAYLCWRMPPGKLVRSALLGLSPLLAWKAFSLVYYGSLLPNTAHAKLVTGMGWDARLMQGFVYFRDQLLNDPLSCVVIVAAAIVAVVTGRRRVALPVAGLLLYLAYVGAIGGSFMLGRYFAAPLLLAVIALAQPDGPLGRLRVRSAVAVAIAMLAFGWVAPQPTLASGADFAKSGGSRRGTRLSDERFFYYSANGLLPALQRGTHTVSHYFHGVGLGLRSLGGVHVVPAVGMVGLAAGPAVHIVDLYGITDPLLARLPAWQRHAPPWAFRGVGHLVRRLPQGYVRSLREGVNRIGDRRIAELHSQLQLITRAPLWSASRWRAIAAQYGRITDPIDPSYAWRFAERVPLDELLLAHADRQRSPDTLPIDPERGLHVDTGPLTGIISAIDIALHPPGRYRLQLTNVGQAVATLDIKTPQRRSDGLARFLVEMPAHAQVPWDAVHIVGVDETAPASIAHLRPLRGYRRKLTLGDLAAVHPSGAPWSAPGAVEIFPHAPIWVRLPTVSRSPRWDISVDFNDIYAVDFHLGHRRVATLQIHRDPKARPGLRRFELEVPEAAQHSGYDGIRLRLIAGDAYCSIGHLVPTD